MKYSHILSEVMATPWAIRPEKLNAIMAFLRLKAEGMNLTTDDIALVKQEPREPYMIELDPLTRAGAVAHEASEGKDASGAWAGAAARDRLAKWASSDGSGDKDKMDWAKYRRGFAWYDSSSPEEFGSYKLPHHDVKDGKFIVVRAGVHAAMEALLGSRGGTSIPDSDRKAVYNHLAAEYRVFNEEPPEFHSQS